MIAQLAGVSSTTLLGSLAAVTIVVVGIAAVAHVRGTSSDGADVDTLPDGADVEQRVSTEDGEAQLVSFDEPDIKTARWGLFQKLWRMRRKMKKRRRFANKGYVQWFLIDDTFPKPKFVKPQTDGSGIPYVVHKGKRYLFPKEAMVASEEQGIWTIAHKANEADPINLRDPSKNAIPADTLEEVATLMVTSSKPGLLDKFDIDAKSALRWIVIGLIGFAIFQSVIGGGL
ncbi:hypothetical protein HWV23_02730 [Natronomonas halophila]|uniref:hypothetical protein n=1 Tax=Natronomonas halophila TaxID=2747817 RepID=UPI0015B77B95|nr:hypothetical protein [Natronomonas halophila]QLD84617.1 hypothetical protein HWV23_02455 [Natronomonas halophila]QLD84671.1 hypothetical protein HWV23_02730 [Natronomonas halophila]